MLRLVSGETEGILNKLESLVNKKSPHWRPATGLGERLKEAFDTNSVQEIADRLEMSYQGVDHLIKGRRKFSDALLIQIAALTDCSIHWLLLGEGPKNFQHSPLFKLSPKAAREKLSNTDRAMVESLIAALKRSLKP